MTLQITACRTEYAQNPIGIDIQAPRLFWRLESDDRAVRQEAYQILVASSRDKLERDELLEEQADCSIFQIGSGKYVFTSKKVQSIEGVRV